MKVAVFVSSREVIVLQVKGEGQSKKDIDGYSEWFGKVLGRYVEDFDVTLCHIGAGAGILVQAPVVTRWLNNASDINDWF